MTKITRKHFAGAMLLSASLALGMADAKAQGTLVVGMTAGDLPITTGNPDQGFEGYRFVGYSLYDTLILWDLSQGDTAAGLRPTKTIPDAGFSNCVPV